ncbi:hypothetical protein [Pantoea cypripedii]|uniref:Uncharacterized protein n=1 Tax=Pantoea cypripedii TaxID=55209 RepID=A0A1X1EYT4_PANCY|nr:hypothetical protein [Pantoea cypripedii]MBP2195092.1 hypothetical protein [Pantoea cypripedii]ORM94935.1 hypothetical protein HA50_16915 [Pantoea cypripedii]
MKDAYTREELFHILANERTSHRIELARAEGALMMIDALQRLGLVDEPDDDSFRSIDWKLGDVAAQLAELSVRGEVPPSWQEMFDRLCEKGRKLNEAVWTYFYDRAVENEEWLIAMENSEADF